VRRQAGGARGPTGRTGTADRGGWHGGYAAGAVARGQRRAHCRRLAHCPRCGGRRRERGAGGAARACLAPVRCCLRARPRSARVLSARRRAPSPRPVHIHTYTHECSPTHTCVPVGSPRASAQRSASDVRAHTLHLARAAHALTSCALVRAGRQTAAGCSRPRLCSHTPRRAPSRSASQVHAPRARRAWCMRRLRAATGATGACHGRACSLR
jgi:hypothetical protein